MTPIINRKTTQGRELSRGYRVSNNLNFLLLEKQYSYRTAPVGCSFGLAFDDRVVDFRKDDDDESRPLSLIIPYNHSLHYFNMVAVRKQQEELLIVQDDPLNEVIPVEIKKEADVKEAIKGVTFHPGVFVRECLHITNYSFEERLLCWYTRREFQVMKMEYYPIVQKLSAGTWNEEDETEESVRGLEWKTREAAMKRKMNKLNALMSVLDEQERQRYSGLRDDDALALGYCCVNEKCVLAARVRGTKDRIQVQKILDDDCIASMSSKMERVCVDSPTKRKAQGEDEADSKKSRLLQLMQKSQNNLMRQHE
jgi:hypothetical protein